MSVVMLFAVAIVYCISTYCSWCDSVRLRVIIISTPTGSSAYSLILLSRAYYASFGKDRCFIFFKLLVGSVTHSAPHTGTFFAHTTYSIDQLSGGLLPNVFCCSLRRVLGCKLLSLSTRCKSSEYNLQC